MTTKEIIETQYLPWLRANGVTAVPEVQLADWDPVPGFDPPLEVKWRGVSGSKLDQPAELIASDILANDGGINGKMGLWLFEVRACTGTGMVGGPGWREWKSAPAPDAPAPSILGDRLTADYVKNFQVDQSREYYGSGANAKEGAVYRAPDGRRYLCIRVGIMGLWWVAL